MKSNAFTLGAMIVILLSCGERVALGQTEDLRKYEVGVHFTALSVSESFNPRTEPGIGGRFTYNLTEMFALEAEGNFFLRSDSTNGFRTGGRAVQGLFGVKVGKRYRTFGIFAKARPGLISFSQGAVDFTVINPAPGGAFAVQATTRRLTHFAADLGGVLEFYPSKRIVVRFDGGDTIIHAGKITSNSFTMTAPGVFVPFPLIFQSDTSHNFQFSAGVGFRF